MRNRLPANSLMRHTLLGLVAAILAGILIYIVDPFPDYQLAEVAIFAIAGAGLTILIGLNGQLSLGHGALLGIGAYTTSLLVQHYANLAPPLVMLASVAVTTLGSMVVGAAAARLRGPYLAGATLALAIGLPGITLRFSGVFGGDQGLSVRQLTTPAELGSDFPSERWLAYICLVGALVTFVLLANIARSRFGRDFRAVRDDEIAAALSGIRITTTQVTAFVLSGACAGLAGSLFAYWQGIAAPASFGLALSLSILAAVVIGGLGSLAGTVYGAAAIVFLPQLSNGLTGALHLPGAVKDNMPLALYGGVFVVTMLLVPNGIQGGLLLLRRQLAGRLRIDPRA
jgi:branched-chain amino acid transport system permease protein